MSVSIKVAPHGELAEQTAIETTAVPVSLSGPSDVSLDMRPNEVQAISRSGNALVLQLVSGEQVVINDFFSSADASHLYFQDDEFSGEIFLANLPADPPAGALALSTVAVADTSEDDDEAGGLFAGGSGIALGALALAGLAAAAGGGGGGGGGSDSSGGGSGGGDGGGGGGGVGGSDTTAPDAPVVEPTNGTAVSGTAEPGSTVTLVVDGEVVGETTADSDGNWQVDVEPDLEHGDVISVTATDDAGNEGPATEVEVDAQAPVVTLDDQVTNDDTPQLSGEVDDPDATVVVTVNGEDYPATNNGDGTWTLADDTLPPLEDGTYEITVTATDPVGNQSQDSGSLEIDTTPPPAPDINPTNGEVVTGTAEPDARVFLTVDGEEIGAVQVDSAGNWSYDPTPDLPDGTEIQAVAVDEAGNESPPDTEIVDISFVDTTPPPAPLLDATDGTEVSGTAEAGSTVTLTVDGEVVGEVKVDAQGNWATDLDPDLQHGDEIVGVATDAAGNVSEPGSVIVDNAGPDVTVDDLATRDTTPELSGTVDDPDAQVLVTVEGETYTAANNGDGTWTLADNTLPPLGQGVTNIGVTATDPQGNSNFASGSVTVDSVAPVVALDDFATSDSTPPLSGTIDDPVATVTVRVDGQNYQATNNGDGTWSLPDNTLGPMDDGANTITLTATDPAGNSGSGSATVTVDPSAVSVMLNNLLTNDATPPLQGTIDSPDATIVVTAGGTDYNATNNGDGTWTLADDTLAALPEGETEITVTAENSVGTSDSDTATVTVDTTAPAVALADIETQDATPALAGTVDDPGATVVVTVAGVDYPAQNNGDGTWTLADGTVAELAEGGTQVTVTATDAAGNSGSDMATVTLDTITDATVTVDDIDTTSDTTPLLSGTSNNVAGNITVEIGGETVMVTPTADGSWSTEWPTALAEGGYTVTATGLDADGLPASGSDDFNIGAVLPTVNNLVLDTAPLDNAVVAVLSPLGIDLSLQGVLQAVDNAILGPLLSAALGTLGITVGELVDDILAGTRITGTASGAAQVQMYVGSDDFLSSADDSVVPVASDGSFSVPLNDILDLVEGVLDTLGDVNVELAFRAVNSDGEVSDTAFASLGNATNLLDDPLGALSDELDAILGEDANIPIDHTEFISSDVDPSTQSTGDIAVLSATDAPMHTLAGDFESGQGNHDGVLIDDTLQVQGSGARLDFVSDLDPAAIGQIAAIDLTGSGDNAVTLDLEAIAVLSGGQETLRLEGNAGDSLRLDVDLSASLTGVATYDDYVGLQFDNGTSLLIDDDLAVSVA